MSYKFKFSHEDLHWTSDIIGKLSVKDVDNLSKFDRLICEEWVKKMQMGFFRYSLESMPSRVVPGYHGYVLQLNRKRGVERRKPEFIESLSKPFDSTKFNFTKVKKEEIICELCPQHDNDRNQAEETRHLVLINVSPLEFGHILLVPDVDQHISQRLTFNAVKLGIDLLLLSAHPGWRVGFNSLCALASVNHQHLHAWYLETSISAEYAPVNEIGGGLFELRHMPTSALAFQLSNHNTEKLARNVFIAANYMQQNNIAHNLFMTRGNVFGQGSEDEGQTVRVFIWPRKSVVGQKNECINQVVFNVAVAELAGHIPMYAPEKYETMTEEYINDRLKEQMLPDEEFNRICANVKSLLLTEELREPSDKNH